MGGFLGLRPMAVAMVFSFFDPESLLFDKWIRQGGKGEEKETNLEDFDRTEERDHHGREEEGVGNMEMRQRRSELVKDMEGVEEDNLLRRESEQRDTVNEWYNS